MSKNLFNIILIIWTSLLISCNQRQEIAPKKLPSDLNQIKKPSVTEEKLYLFSKKVDGGIYPDYKLYGYKNALRETIINAKYDFAEPFEGNVAKVAKIENTEDIWRRSQREQLMWGLINKDDSVIIELKYYEIKKTKSGEIVSLGPNGSFIFNKNGDTLKTLQHYYESERPYNDSLISVQSRDGGGLMDSSYNYIIEPKFGWIGGPDEDYYRTQVYNVEERGFSLGYLDLEGKVIIPIKYQMAGPFHESKAMVKNPEESIKLIDKQGNTISFIEDFLDSLVTEDFNYDNFDAFKDCTSNLKLKDFLFSVRNCRDTLYLEKVYENYTESCPHGGECSHRFNYYVYSSGYIRIESYYEGYPRIEYYLNSSDLNLALNWSDSLISILEFSVSEEIESTDSTYYAKLVKETDRIPLTGQIRVQCNSKECVVSPHINDNY